MDRLRPIPVSYAGTEFRSRAEARWAMVFDALECPWSYEEEGFQLETCWYLPDFWLPKLRTFAEVKASLEQWDGLAERKAAQLVKASGRPLLICADINASHLAQSAFRGHLWLEKEPPTDPLGIDAALLSKLEAIRTYRFYAPSR